MTNPNDPAAPAVYTNPAERGLTKREYLTAFALQGLLANGPVLEAVAKQVTESERAKILGTSAVDMADAAIAALNEMSESAK